MDNTQGEVATFIDADLSNASITVHFSFYDMRRANFANAHMSVVMSNQSMGLLRTEFMASNLDGANFEGAGLAHGARGSQPARLHRLYEFRFGGRVAAVR
jgi:hypothetical protein